MWWHTSDRNVGNAQNVVTNKIIKNSLASLFSYFPGNHYDDEMVQISEVTSVEGSKVWSTSQKPLSSYNNFLVRLFNDLEFIFLFICFVNNSNTNWCLLTCQTGDLKNASCMGSGSCWVNNSQHMTFCDIDVKSGDICVP